MHSDQDRRAEAAFVPAIALVLIANFIPLYSVLAYQWPVLFVVMLFWFDVLLMVLFTAVKIVIVPLTGYRTSAIVVLKVGFAGATLVFYGGLVLAYGVFLFMLFSGAAAPRGGVANPELSSEEVIEMLGAPAVLWAALAIVANHLRGLFVDFIGRGVWRSAHPEKLFDMPLRQIVALHVGLVLGGGALSLLATPLVAATVLVVAKTLSDLRQLIGEPSVA
jgi:hypothetical protein